MRIAMPQNRAQLDHLVATERRRLVALLIGTMNPNTLQDEIVDRVYDSSRELNAKAAGEILLLNRQGFLYILPQGKYEGPHHERFSRTRDLATLANYARTFLSEGQDFHRSDKAAAEENVRRMQQWIRQYETTFDASVTQTRSWEVLSRALQLDKQLQAWSLYFGAGD
jgi:hypothetical protein